MSPEPPYQSATLDETVPKLRGAGRVLLVEDEDLVRASTADVLGELGYRVIEARSAEEALQLANGARFDLVITDHLMPGMTGTDLVERLHVSHPAVPAVLVSGYAEASGIAASLPRLTKPLRRSELAALLATLPGQTSTLTGSEDTAAAVGQTSSTMLHAHIILRARR